MDLDYAVLLGRFAPFHVGHLALAEYALARARRLLVVLGSAGESRSTLHPWSVEERSEMIRLGLGAQAHRVTVVPVRDSLYLDARWLADVQREVGVALRDEGAEGAVRIGVVATPATRTRDGVSLFPQWHELAPPERAPIDARALAWAALHEAGEATAGPAVEELVPSSVLKFLHDFRVAPVFEGLLAERRALDSYRAAWASAPYAPIFVTTDAVVVCAGHLLLIRRRGMPGRGLDALPGGFVDGEESLFEGCLRELEEETQLEVPVATLRGALRGSHVFDHPDRSARRRTVTHGFYFDLGGGPLPAVRSGDDAEAARFVPLGELAAHGVRFFEDHRHILEHFVGRL